MMLQANSAAIPFILPLVGAVTTLFLPRARILAVIFLFCSLIYSVWLCMATYSGNIFVTYVGGWLAPYGIALAIDTFSALMLLFSNLVFILATLYGFTEESHFCRLPLIFLLQAGVSLSFVTADFFNLFVSFEILLTSSYALLLLEVPETKRGKAFPYIMINIIGSFLFLTAAAMAYGATGNLNMAALHLSLAENPESPLVLCLGITALIIYGLKAGLFPFYFWLPDTYPLLPSSLAGLFGGVLTKVGIYVLIRLFMTVLPHSLHNLHMVLLTLAGLTMFLGVLGAMSQKTIKKILSYHILSQVGYMALGLGIFTANALAAGLIFVIHNIIVKSSLFWIGGVATRNGGGEELGKMKALWAAAPLLGICFLFQALSLAGVPPLSGFWGKYLLFSSALDGEHYLLLLLALVTSFWTLFSMVKIWLGAFWGEEQVEKVVTYNLWSILPITLSVVVSLALGLGVEIAYKVSIHAANELFTPALYVQAVLGGKV
jgi:multicomponent Na+:H+ antiporter subunit D